MHKHTKSYTHLYSESMSVSVDEITTLSVTLKYWLCATKPERECEWRTSG